MGTNTYSPTYCRQKIQSIGLHLQVTEMSKLSDNDFKTTRFNILKHLLHKVDNMHKEKGIFSREMEL